MSAPSISSEVFELSIIFYLLRKDQPKIESDQSGIVMLSKPIIRDLSETERNQIHYSCKENVGYTVYQHDESTEYDRTKILTAHVLNGVNITPEIKFQAALRTKIIEDLHESPNESIIIRKDSSLPTTSSELFEAKPSPIFVDLTQGNLLKGIVNWSGAT